MRIEFDDGVDDKLIEGSDLLGPESIPELDYNDNVEIPKNLVSIQKANITKNKRSYIHFYTHDQYFRSVLKHADKWIPLFQTFDGVITPDPSFKIDKGRWFVVRSVWVSRAIGCYLQKKGIPVIPNVRWGRPNSYDFCFLGIPKHSVVAISTVGVIKKCKEDNNELRTIFKDGLKEMLVRLEPSHVIVYGRMPNDIFGEYLSRYRFHNYQSETEIAHLGGIQDGR